MSEPTLLLTIDRGKVYETPAGGIHVAYHVEGAAEDSHIEIPAAAVRMARAMQNGNAPGPLAVLRGLMS